MLDLLYTSDQHVLHGVLESWYSDHKPVWAAIPALETDMVNILLYIFIIIYYNLDKIAHL